MPGHWPAECVPGNDVVTMSSLHIHQSSPGSHGLGVVRWGDGRGSGQVPLPHSPLTWPGGGGGGVFVAPVSGAGVGLVALQHVLGIRGGGGKVLQRFGD